MARAMELRADLNELKDQVEAMRTAMEAGVTIPPGRPWIAPHGQDATADAYEEDPGAAPHWRARSGYEQDQGAAHDWSRFT